MRLFEPGQFAKEPVVLGVAERRPVKVVVLVRRVGEEAAQFTRATRGGFVGAQPAPPSDASSPASPP
jgi:hypothetical protein